MMLAAVHLSPVVTITVAAFVAAWVVWYWQRLSKPDVPPSRRLIRRLSLVVVTAALPVFIAAASFFTAEADGVAYVRIWTAAMALLGLIVLLAMIDVVNNLRLHRIEYAAHRAQSLRELAEAITKKEANERSPAEDSEGGDRSRGDDRQRDDPAA